MRGRIVLGSVNDRPYEGKDSFGVVPVNYQVVLIISFIYENILSNVFPRYAFNSLVSLKK